jgi:hypothetical protein
MVDVILAVAVVAVHQYIGAVVTLFFNVPTLYGQRLEKKQKREQTAYKINCSIKYDTPTSMLKAKLSLLDVLVDDNRAYMHKVTQNAGRACKHDYLHRLYFCLKWLNNGILFCSRELETGWGKSSVH